MLCRCYRQCLEEGHLQGQNRHGRHQTTSQGQVKLSFVPHDFSKYLCNKKCKPTLFLDHDFNYQFKSFESKHFKCESFFFHFFVYPKTSPFFIIFSFFGTKTRRTWPGSINWPRSITKSCSKNTASVICRDLKKTRCVVPFRICCDHCTALPQK